MACVAGQAWPSDPLVGPKSSCRRPYRGSSARGTRLLPKEDPLQNRHNVLLTTLCSLLVLQSACLLLTLAGTSCRCASGARLSLHRAAPERGGRSRGSSGHLALGVAHMPWTQHRARRCHFSWSVYPMVSGIPFTAQILNRAADLRSARIRGTASRRTCPGLSTGHAIATSRGRCTPWSPAFPSPCNS